MHCIQEIETSGARAMETFEHAGTRYLVVPQLARDAAGQPALMTLGASDADTLVYRWENGQFTPHASLPVPGGEDAEFFRIGGRAFVATASLRTGCDPYELNTESIIFEIMDGGRFVPFQKIPGFAAKQWTHFTIDGRHFLALAQNVAMPGEKAKQAADSCIYEWDGERFMLFQTVESAWGYNWAFFEVEGVRLLAYADHAAPSRLLRWNGKAFEPFQELDGKTGRAFCFFETEGQAWLAFANLHHDTVLYRWDGKRFVLHQTLSGPGGRELTWVMTAKGGRLVQINFLHGTREAPIPELDSVIYRMQDQRMVVDETFPTSGGTDAMAFEAGGAQYLAVSNSLSGAVRFATPSRIYLLG